ncbi:MAG: hypothetical protein KGL90_14215 [Burkholderiales bacterium]|nr:hypothetical protein [Burkholderiales bacterium]
MNDQNLKEIVAAAEFFNTTAKKVLAVDGRLHAETLISGVSRMAGSLMYRSFGFDKAIEPGTSVLSDEANIHGPKLMNVMLTTLQQLGRQIGENDLNRDYLSAKFSTLDFRESHDRLAPFFLKYCETAPLGFQPAALGAAVAVASLVHECVDVLPIENGAAIAVFGFVEGTKTAPFPIAGSPQRTPRSTPVAVKKPWYRFW